MSSTATLEIIQCALCGHRFLPGADIMACRRCPLQPRCAVLRCPRCGYEFVAESKLVGFLRRLRRRW
jgi:hypothetical protein